jgi:rare lipoprotein A
MVTNGTDRVELRVIGYVAQPEGMGPLRVQAGAFADYENARALLERIERDFPDGRIIYVDLPEGRRYRVRFGRFLTESEAQRIADRFNRAFGLQSLVIRDDG